MSVGRLTWRRRPQLIFWLGWQGRGGVRGKEGGSPMGFAVVLVSVARRSALIPAFATRRYTDRKRELRTSRHSRQRLRKFPKWVSSIFTNGDNGESRFPPTRSAGGGGRRAARDHLRWSRTCAIIRCRKIAIVAEDCACPLSRCHGIRDCGDSTRSRSTRFAFRGGSRDYIRSLQLCGRATGLYFYV